MGGSTGGVSTDAVGVFGRKDHASAQRAIVTRKPATKNGTTLRGARTTGAGATMGATAGATRGAATGLFGASRSPFDAPETFRYADDAGSLRWNDDTFARIGTPFESAQPTRAHQR